MKGFGDIIGHEQIIEFFRRVLRNGQISHAYILNGEDGAGKNLLADAFSKAILCEAGYGDSCDMCKSCRQFNGHNHPDIKRLLHEKPRTISVDNVREQIVTDIAIKPYSSKHKIYIIDEAELMNNSAQNAILKTIEEPPEYAVLILLTNSLEKLLPTIRSRCVVLNLRGVDNRKIESFLMKEHQIPDYQAKICTGYAQGNVGKAVKMARSDEFRRIYNFVMQILKKIDDMDIYEISAMTKDIAKYKQNIRELLDMMLIWYRDGLVVKATDNINQVVYSKEYTHLKKKAIKSSYEGLNNIIEAFHIARNRIDSNVNFETTIEMLLVTIKEN